MCRTTMVMNFAGHKFRATPAKWAPYSGYKTEINWLLRDESVVMCIFFQRQEKQCFPKRPCMMSHFSRFIFTKFVHELHESCHSTLLGNSTRGLLSMHCSVFSTFVYARKGSNLSKFVIPNSQSCMR